VVSVVIYDYRHLSRPRSGHRTRSRPKPTPAWLPLECGWVVPPIRHRCHGPGTKAEDTYDGAGVVNTLRLLKDSA